MQGLRVVSAIGAALTADEIEAAHRVANTHQEMRSGVVRIEDKATGVLVEYHANKRLILTSPPLNLLGGGFGVSVWNTAQEVGIVFASTEDGVYLTSANNTSSVFSTDGTLLASTPVLTAPLRDVFVDINTQNLSKTSTETDLWDGESTWPLWKKDPVIQEGQISFTLPENTTLPIATNRAYRLAKSSAVVASVKSGVLIPEVAHAIKSTYSLITNFGSRTFEWSFQETQESEIRIKKVFGCTINLSGQSFTGSVSLTTYGVIGKSFGDGGVTFSNTAYKLVFDQFPIDVSLRVVFSSFSFADRALLGGFLDQILDQRVFNNGNFGIINGTCYSGDKWDPYHQVYDHGSVARTGPPYITTWGDEPAPISYPKTDFSGLSFTEPAVYANYFSEYVAANPHEVLTFLIGYGSNNFEFGMFPRSDDIDNIVSSEDVTKAHVYGVARWRAVGGGFLFVDWLDPVPEFSTFPWQTSFGTPNCMTARLTSEPTDLKKTLSTYPNDSLKYAHAEGDVWEMMRYLILAVTGRAKPNRTPPA